MTDFCWRAGKRIAILRSLLETQMADFSFALGGGLQF
jgi:hypothetical protein